MAHTVLLPLDLDLGLMDDPHLVFSQGRLVFDTALPVEGQVETAGFKVKALEKLIAGFAPIIYSMDPSVSHSSVQATPDRSCS